MFNNRRRYLETFEEGQKNDMEREAHKAWRKRMIETKTPPKFDWIAWGPITLFVLIVLFGGIAFVTAGSKKESVKQPIDPPKIKIEEKKPAPKALEYY